MLYTAILAAHITAACVAGVVLAYALYVLAKTKQDFYRTSALMLGFVAGFQVLSGTTLAVLSPELSAASLTLHIVSYLGICFVAESLLFMRMQKVSLVFPYQLVGAPVFTSVFAFVLAVSYGF